MEQLHNNVETFCTYSAEELSGSLQYVSYKKVSHSYVVTMDENESQFVIGSCRT